MGILDRYARRPVGEKRDKTVSTKLTEEEYQAFIKYINERGLTTSEAIRWLILEEIGLSVEAKQTPVLKTKIDQSRHKSTYENLSKSSYTEVAATSEKTIKTNRKPSSSRFTYKPWEVNGKLPCTVCGNWYQSSTFSGRHAKEHGYADTKEYFMKNIEKINQMYKDLTGNDPVYDPNMLK